MESHGHATLLCISSCRWTFRRRSFYAEPSRPRIIYPTQSENLGLKAEDERFLLTAKRGYCDSPRTVEDAPIRRNNCTGTYNRLFGFSTFDRKTDMHVSYRSGHAQLIFFRTTETSFLSALGYIIYIDVRAYGTQLVDREKAAERAANENRF